MECRVRLDPTGDGRDPYQKSRECAQARVSDRTGNFWSCLVEPFGCSVE